MLTQTVLAAPTANSQTVSVAFNTAKAIMLTGNDPNSPARPLTYSVTAQPQHGTLSGTAPNVTYTPNASFQGPDSFTFTVSNGVNISPPAIVTLTVAAGVPTANGQSVTTAANTAKSITLTGSDPDAPALTLTYAVASAPAHGALSGFNAATGAVTYTPAAGYAGPDGFTFTVSNGRNASVPATVAVTVLPALTTLSVSPSSITSGYGVTGTVSLNGPAAADSVVTLTDSSASATTPATVTIRAGQTSATFPITTNAVTANTTVTLTAALSGVRQTATLTLTPAPGLAGLSVSPGLVTSGTNATGTVTLTAPAAPGGFTVSLSVLPFGLAGVPGSVVVPQGQTSATFTVSTEAFLLPYTVQVFASSGFQIYSALLTAIPSAHLLALGVGFTVQGGTSTTGTVTLSGVTATPITVMLSATGPASVPGSVTVPAGSCSATFPIATTAVSRTTNATVTAAYGGATQSQTLIVTH